MPTDPTLLSDATADLLAEQRNAQLERTGIRVLPILNRHGWFAVFDDIFIQERFDNEVDAYAFAYKLARELIGQRDLHV